MSKCLRFLFILFLGTLYAQDSTPIVSFELTRDNYYVNQIKKLKESINKNNELELFDSILKFAFQYKDWETSIEYLEKLIKTNPTSMRYFLLGGAAGFRALEVSVFSSLKYINIMKPAFEKALELEPNNSEIIDHLGDIYYKIGRKKEAIYEWKRALIGNADDKLKKDIKSKLNKYAQ